MVVSKMVWIGLELLHGTIIGIVIVQLVHGIAPTSDIDVLLKGILTRWLVFSSKGGVVGLGIEFVNLRGGNKRC